MPPANRDKKNDEWFKKVCGKRAACNKYMIEMTSPQRRRAWFLRMFGMSEKELQNRMKEGSDIPALDALDEQDCY